MNYAFLCLIIAAVFPFIFAGLAKFGGQMAGKKFDNHDPRTYLANLSGWPHRAQAVQLNSWEALPLFIAGVLMATHAGVAQETINLWAFIFILARFIYAGCYLLDYASLRSLIWFVGTGASIRLMVAAL